MATFHIVKPIDMSKSSGLMWHDVPNRGGRINISGDLRSQGDVGLSSAWQGDNASATAVPADAWSATSVTPTGNEWVAVPVITGVTGKIFGRIINRPNGTTAPNNNPRNQPLNVMGNPIPYFPADSADNSGAVMTIRTKETIDESSPRRERCPTATGSLLRRGRDGRGAGYASLRCDLPGAVPSRSTPRISTRWSTR